jgi:hypothetical protein
MGGDVDPGPGGNSDGPRPVKAPKRNLQIENGGGGTVSNDNLFQPYLKPGYKRLYPEHSLNYEFKVFVESADNEKLGNKSPIYLNHIFQSRDVKGVVSVHRVNANKLAVIFKQFNTANNFLTNETFLTSHKLKAYIPAKEIEKTGIIRFVPTNISNKDLYTKLSSNYDIIAVRRFTKKVGDERVPLQTVSITFLSNSLPDSVQYDLFSYRVFEYVPPLLQCFKCFKFNHSAKICNGRQRCSICSGDHFYKECDNPTALCCANCSGPHLAISKACPIKLKKIMEKKTNITYATAAETRKVEFPPLKIPEYTTKPQSHKVAPTPAPVEIPKFDLKQELLQNSDLMDALVRTLVDLGNKTDNNPINSNFIKDLLIKNIK